MLLLGLGGRDGAGGAALYVLPHALAKSALFLVAGIVSQSTGEHSLAKLGGLGRRLPGLAVVAALAGAALAGLPPTLGFFKDELWFAAAHAHSSWLSVGAVLAAGLTLAYVVRFWAGMFLGPMRIEPASSSPVMTGVVAALSLIATVGGIVPGILEAPVSAAASTMLGRAESVKVAYEWRYETGLALAAYAVGAVIFIASRLTSSLGSVFAAARKLTPERLYHGALAALDAVSIRLHRLEVVDLRDRVATIVLPTMLFVGAAFVTGEEVRYRVGALGLGEAPLVAALAVLVLAAVAAALARTTMVMVLTLSAVGYGLAVVFTLLGAPDVALVAVAIETVFTLLFVSALVLLGSGPRVAAKRPRRHLALAVAASLVAGAATFATLSFARPSGVARRYVALAPEAHGADVVTVILADFRGLDTLGEATVIVVALTATLMLLARRNT